MERSTVLRPHGRRFRRIALTILGLLGLLVGGLVGGVSGSAAATTITGVVFQDYNANGRRDTAATVPNNGQEATPVAVDRGVAGVTVTAYDASGAVRGTVTTDGNGTYSLTPSGAGPYRIEFRGWSADYQPGPVGPDSGSSVQFVADGANATNVSMGVIVPGDYCQNNPDLVTNCYVYGDQVNGPNKGMPVVVSFPNSAGSDRQTADPNRPLGPYTDYDAPASHALMVPANKVGTTWGLAYRRSTQTLFAAAYMKRHVGYGPNGPGAIYQIDRATGNVGLYTDLNTLFGAQNAGSLPHAGASCPQDPTNPYNCDNGNTGWNAVGKESLGGLAIADDETMLYVMNLYYRTLYAVPLTATPTAANVRGTAVPTNPPGCPSPSDVRPFAVQVYQGTIYVGLVCSAESTQSANDLRAYVYAVEPASLTFGNAPVFQVALNYPRGTHDAVPWVPWAATVTNTGERNLPYINYPQPMLTDIVFDNGNLILGLRDRFGDQGNYETLTDPARSQQVRSIPAGDILRACGSLATGWTLESNGRCGGQGAAPQGTGQGPGGGEYYYRDESPTSHDELSLGGLAQIPGYPDVAATMYAPIPVFDNLNVIVDSGVRWLINSSGGLRKTYRIYDGTAAGSPIFGKVSGLGDLVALCDAAPIEIGNRLWRDDNGNGIQDAGEPGIAGVTVRLYDAAGALLGTAVTDASGNFGFSSGPGTSTSSVIYGIGGIKPRTAGYVLAADNVANSSVGGVLAGYKLTQTKVGGGSQDGRDSDATLVNDAARITIDTGGPGANNHNYDFGFVPGNTPLAPTPRPPAPAPALRACPACQTPVLVRRVRRSSGRARSSSMGCLLRALSWLSGVWRRRERARKR